MAKRHGFQTIFKRDVPEYAATASLYRHAVTGAELLSLVTSDENKVFGVNFRTPASDATGVAHILEHSVLCGSRDYPVKEPFVELIKGSLHTFLNAFTYPDKTCYPVASVNDRDFFNLARVYLDAVFFPRLTQEIFLQEGWRLELPGKNTRPRRMGVVYNEMKGAYSSPDGVLGDHSQHSLFPDTVYGRDHGGDPKAIPSLTYEQFTAYHAAYYHPANALLYFYGDAAEEQRLALVASYLDQFGPGAKAQDIPLQRFIRRPRLIRVPYAVDGGGPAGLKEYLTVNWLLPEALDPELVLAFELLEHVLIGMSSSPLRKALIDSGLGEDLAGAGLETELRQMYFSIGLKGVDPGKHEKVRALMTKVLSGLVKDGIGAQVIEAAVNSLEFDLRENNTGSFPRGLSLMLRSLAFWLHGADPIAPLRFTAPLEAVKKRLARGEKLFESLITAHFLDNRHRSMVILYPDPELAGRTEAAEQAEVDAAVAGMDAASAKAAKAALARLRRFQQTPDAPEDLAKIPRLAVTDLPASERPIPGKDLPAGPNPVFCHELPTSGIVYLDLGFPLDGAGDAALPLAALFGRALLEMGTDKEDFVSLSRRIARKTGGVWTETYFAALSGGDGTLAESGMQTRLFVRAKATTGNAKALLDILSDVLTRAKLDDPGRFKQLLLETKAASERGLAPRGHTFVNSRMRAGLSLTGAAAERSGGVERLFALRGLAAGFQAAWPGIYETLEALRGLLSRTGLAVNLTADAAGLSATLPGLEALLKSLPTATAAPARRQGYPGPAVEGLSFPARVNYVGKAMRLYGQTPFHGAHLAVARFLKTAYLWDHVRVRGGAYGSFSLLDRFTGIVSFLSYRDPNCLKTLDVFDKAADFLVNLDLPQEELDKTVIGTIGDIDAYMLPDAKGFAALSRRLVGDTPVSRQKLREEVLATNIGHFREFGELLAKARDQARIAVLGSRETLNKARKKLPEMVLTDVG